MSEDKKTTKKKSFSFDWLIGGVLTKVGDTFDRLTGRGWNPSSSLATSKLVEKLKFLLDSEVRELDDRGKFVPHIIKLKIQWNKFSTDSDEELEKLEHELHAAAIDHINDKLYHTYAPLNIEIKTDYFTEGVRMLASFGKYAENEEDEVAINVTLPNLRTDQLLSDNKITVNLSGQDQTVVQPQEEIYLAKYSLQGKDKEVVLNFSKKKRISVGRFKENDLSIFDQSISKVHASLVFNNEKGLMVADTGSTNGTFLNGERIKYGKAFPINEETTVKFGNVEVVFEKQFTEQIYEESINHQNGELMPTQAVVELDEQTPIEAKQKVNQLNPSEIHIPKPDVSTEIKAAKLEQTKLDSKHEKAKDNTPKLAKTEAWNQTHENNQPSSNGLKEDDLINKKSRLENEKVKHEEIKPQPESESEKKSKQINIDETQDWEI